MKNETPNVELCASCEREGVLLRSHIIPNLYWARLRKLKLESGDASYPADFSIVKNGKKCLQKSIRERLLCSACEAFFSKLETDAPRDVLDKHPALNLCPERIVHGFKRVGNVDHLKAKLFYVSIFYRMVLAREFQIFDDALFSQPNLTRVKQFLETRDDDPTIQLHAERVWLPDFLGHAHSGKEGDYERISMIFFGCRISCICDPSFKKYQGTSGYLQTNGHWEILDNDQDPEVLWQLHEPEKILSNQTSKQREYLTGRD